MKVKEMMFAMLRSVICGVETAEEVKNACTPELLQKTYALAKKHDLGHLVGQAAADWKLPESETVEQCKQAAMKALYRYVRLDGQFVAVCSTLEAAQIPFIPLKGSVLRAHYPQPWMRTSCDMDILVHETDLDQAVACLKEKLKYQYQGRSPHDVSLFSPGGVHLELHYSTIEDFVSKKAEQILSGIWEAATPVAGWQYHLEIPDSLFYYYHIAHMAKHIEHGGCGVRPFLDIWVLKYREEHDPQARHMLLENGGLRTFANAVEQLSEIWFSGAQYDPLSLHLETYIFEGGVYGNEKNRIALNQSKRGGKLQYALSRIFLPYDIMKHYYPVLQKHKWLLAWYHVKRWCKLLFRGGVSRSVQELQTNAQISYETEMTLEKLITHLGLDH